MPKTKVFEVTIKLRYLTFEEGTTKQDERSRWTTLVNEFMSDRCVATWGEIKIEEEEKGANP